MSDFTVVNLKNVEDMAEKFGLAPGLESRFARVPLGLKESGLSYFRVAPNFRTPFGHTHSTQEEIYLVISGSLTVKLDEEIVGLEPWDAVRIPSGTWRAFEGGKDGAEIVAFGAPNTENKDIEMEQEWWKS